jgi:hypothetical protein
MQQSLLGLLLFLLSAQAWLPPRSLRRATKLSLGEIVARAVVDASPDAAFCEAVLGSLADKSFLKLTLSGNAAEAVDSDATCVFGDPLYRFESVACHTS